MKAIIRCSDVSSDFTNLSFNFEDSLLHGEIEFAAPKESEVPVDGEPDLTGP